MGVEMHSYMLVAMGGLTQPKLEIGLYSSDDTAADKEAQLVVANIAAANYFNFALFNIQDKDKHQLVAEYRVEVPKPVVRRR